MKSNLKAICDVSGGVYMVECISAEEHEQYEFEFRINDEEHWTDYRLTMSVPRDMHWQGQLMDAARAFGLIGDNGDGPFDLDDFVGKTAFALVNGSKEVTAYYGGDHVVSALGREEAWASLMKHLLEERGTLAEGEVIATEVDSVAEPAAEAENSTEAT